MCLYLKNLPAGYMPKTQGSTWQQKVYLIAGKSPSQMEMMKVQLFQGTARWVLLHYVSHYHTRKQKIICYKYDTSEHQSPSVSWWKVIYLEGFSYQLSCQTACANQIVSFQFCQYPWSTIRTTLLVNAIEMYCLGLLLQRNLCIMWCF